VANVTGALEATVFAEDLARLPGLLQRLDPRAKVVSFLAYLLAVSFARHLTVLLGLYAIAMVFAYLGRIPLVFFLKRVWLFVPIFAGVIAAPAIFSFVTPGRAVLDLPVGASVTEQGLRTAAFLVLRVATSVSFGVLLILSTRWPALLKALRVLKVPQVFVLILGMTHRYIFLLLHTANNMFIARQSRTVGRIQARENRRWIAGAMGTLVGRSYQLSNEVYLAMISRGFRGEAMVIDDFRMKVIDWVWTSISVGLALAVILAEQSIFHP